MKPALPLLTVLLLSLLSTAASAQDLNFTATRAEVDFSKKLQTWDGFGFNCVETALTMDCAKDPQAYGGFSLLKEEAGGAFDHETTTEDQKETFTRIGAFLPNDGALTCEVPGGSVTTFFADEP